MAPSLENNHSITYLFFKFCLYLFFLCERENVSYITIHHSSHKFNNLRFAHKVWVIGQEREQELLKLFFLICKEIHQSVNSDEGGAKKLWVILFVLLSVIVNFLPNKYILLL